MNAHGCTILTLAPEVLAERVCAGRLAVILSADRLRGSRRGDSDECGRKSDVGHGVACEC